MRVSRDVVERIDEVAFLRAIDAVSGIARDSFRVNATSNERMNPSDVTVTEDENGGLVVELRAERIGWQPVWADL